MVPIPSRMRTENTGWIHCREWEFDTQLDLLAKGDFSIHHRIETLAADKVPNSGVYMFGNAGGVGKVGIARFEYGSNDRGER